LKKIIIALFVIISICITVPVYAQTAKDAYKSLKKVEALTETNIYGRDYLNAYAEAKAEVELYLANPESQKKPALKNSISRATLAYKWAGNFWASKMSKDKYIHESEPIYKKIIVDFPEAKESIKMQGTIQYNDAIGFMYGVASSELAKAAKELYKK